VQQCGCIVSIHLYSAYCSAHQSQDKEIMMVKWA